MTVPDTLAARTARPRIPFARIGVLGAVGIGLIVAAAILSLVGGQFYTRVAIEALVFGMLALSVDVLLGYAGLLSLGQAAYFGLGAYAAALLLAHLTSSFWVILLVVVALSTIVSLALGAVALRTSGVYFALITFGFGELLYKLASHTYAIGGSDGIIGVPVASLGLPASLFDLADDRNFLYFVLALFGLVYLAVARMLATPFGLVLRAVHENEQRAGYLAYDTYRYKLAAFVLAANLAGIAGMIYPMLRGFASPTLFSFETSIMAVVMALVGGLGTLIGAFVGAGVVTFVETIVSTFTRHYIMVIGALFVACVIFFPGGLVGTLEKRFEPRGEDA